MHFRKIFHLEGRKKNLVWYLKHVFICLKNEFVILILFSENKKEIRLNCILILKCQLSLPFFSQFWQVLPAQFKLTQRSKSNVFHSPPPPSTFSNFYLEFSFRKKGFGGTAGMAFVGTVCSRSHAGGINVVRFLFLIFNFGCLRQDSVRHLTTYFLPWSLKQYFGQK